MSLSAIFYNRILKKLNSVNPGKEAKGDQTIPNLNRFNYFLHLLRPRLNDPDESDAHR